MIGERVLSVVFPPLDGGSPPAVPASAQEACRPGAERRPLSKRLLADDKSHCKDRIYLEAEPFSDSSSESDIPPVGNSGGRKRRLPKVVSDQSLQGDCAICGEPATAADHDHLSGRSRGELCTSCNLGLGYFKDSPKLLKLAADYLERWKTEHDTNPIDMDAVMARLQEQFRGKVPRSLSIRQIAMMAEREPS